MKASIALSCWSFSSRFRPRKYERGYGAIFSKHIKQADQGCDFDFLEGAAPVPEPEIH